MSKNSGKWTDGRYRAFVTSALRGAMRRWPPKWDCLREAFVGVKLNKKSGKKAKHYECAKCHKHFPQSGVQVDHIEPVVSKEGFTTWDVFIERLFCEKENLQILCKGCHKKKTKKDRK